MSDGKKTDLLDDSVPTETPKLLQKDLGLDRRGPVPPPPAANLKDTSPYYPSPATLKEATGEHPAAPEYANTVISNRQVPPSPLDFARTQPSAANPVLAKLQAQERAATERLLAERQLAEREAAERAANLRLVAERAAAGPTRPPVPTAMLGASPGVAAPRPRDPSLLTTDPARPAPAALPRAQPLLRQPLASRPLPPVAAPVKAANEVITDPMPRTAVPPAATVVQRPPASAVPKTDPMQQPDVLAAIARSSEPSRVAIPPPAPLVSRAPASRPLPAAPERTEVYHPPAPQPPAPAERTEVTRPAPQPPAPAERTEVTRPPPPGVPLPAAALKTTPGLAPLPQIHAPHPLPPAPAPVERTEVARQAAPGVPMPQIHASPAPIEVAPTLRTPQVIINPPRQLSPVDVTPVPPMEAVPKGLEPDTLPPPPRAFVVPPSFAELPPAMEKPRRMGPDLATTQPGIPGPYSNHRPLPIEDAPPSGLPTDTVENLRVTGPDEAVESDQVLAAPASLWRRACAAILDLALLGGCIGGLLMLAASIAGAAPPAGLEGLDAFLFRVQPIAIPAGVAAVLLAMLYTTFGALKGRTLGRLLLGIRLVDSSGKAPGMVRSVLRAVFSLVSFALFLAGFWLALFDRRGQTLHDKLTRTFVVRPV